MRHAVFVLVFGLCCDPIHAQPKKPIDKDTLYAVSFLDLVESLEHRMGSYQTKYNLEPEKEVMNRIIEKSLKDHFIVLRVPDSCYYGLKLDSVSRRKKEFLKGICSKCLLSKRIVILDAVWEYLDFYSMEILRHKHRTSGTSANYFITGTWWDVNAYVYSPNKNGFDIHIRKRYTQWSNARPVKRWPGISHKRFFKRPIKEVRKFLINESYNKK